MIPLPYFTANPRCLLDFGCIIESRSLGSALYNATSIVHPTELAASFERLEMP